MGRWGAEREGSNSFELPFLLLPEAPTPGPRPLRPPIQPCRAALPLPLVQPHLIPRGGRGGTPALAALRPWPAHSQDLFLPTAEEPEPGVLIHAMGSGIRRRLGSGWRQADAASPPGGARVQLGCSPRPAPAWPRPQSAVGAEPHRCWDSPVRVPSPARWS